MREKKLTTVIVISFVLLIIFTIALIRLANVESLLIYLEALVTLVALIFMYNPNESHYNNKFRYFHLHEFFVVRHSSQVVYICTICCLYRFFCGGLHKSIEDAVNRQEMINLRNDDSFKKNEILYHRSIISIYGLKNLQNILKLCVFNKTDCQIEENKV